MVKFFFSILVVFNTIAVSAQQPEHLAQRLNNLESITDANKKRNEMLAISKNLQKLWTTSGDVIQVKKLSNQLNLVKSEDNEVTISAFGAATYTGFYQLEWLINYKDKTWSFSEEIAYNTSKGDPVLTFSFINTNKGLYGLEVKNGKQVILKAVDLVTKCLFEDIHTLETDMAKDSLNAIIQKRLVSLWVSSELFKDDFKQLKRMKTLRSNDNQIKVCTYNVQKEGFRHQFHGAVIINEKGIKISLLSDATEKIRSPERSSLTNKKWYGAIYTNLIENISGNKTYYTLLGYKGHDEFVKTRVIDVLTVQNGRLRFGSPIFKTDRITRNRMVYKYSAGATMMLRYDPKQKLIVLDNLAPSNPMFRGVYQYYGPDFSYNSFKFTKGVWVLKKDVDLRNPKR